LSEYFTREQPGVVEILKKWRYKNSRQINNSNLYRMMAGWIAEGRRLMIDGPGTTGKK
jgi:hypothetical protein